MGNKFFVLNSKTSIKTLILTLLLAPVLLSTPIFLSSCSKVEQEPILSFDGRIMGTSYQVKIVPNASVDIEAIRLASHEALEKVDWAMSTYKQDSELSKFNRSGVGEWIEVSYGLLEVVGKSVAISEMTAGAFDVTVGPLVNLWGFGPDKRPVTIPSDEEIAAVRDKVGFKALEFKVSPPSIRKTKDVYVDLSAIAKGYGVDQVANVLDKFGITSYLVEVGGEMKASGAKPNGQSWAIGIEAPIASQRMVQLAVPLIDAAVATSGDYRNFYEEDGVRYSHTIDGVTGKPITHNLASVTVFDPSAARADALATAIMVAGPEMGMRFARENDLSIYMIIREKDKFIEFKSEKFKELLALGTDG